ncbi:MAG: DUF692 domain-containing protein [Candidatus Eremiobacteraeota bacterium]|nr:DUF692 domain-containing protein [Candidatus Eremiobacteraeota bacterium]
MIEPEVLRMTGPAFGLLYRVEHRAALFRARPLVEALEIVAEHFLDLTAEQRDELELLRAHFPITVHALGTSIGSADGVDERYLERIARLVAFVRPRWWSDHLAFTRVGTVELGAFAPLPHTYEAVEVVARNAARVRAVVDAPFALENPAAPFAVAGAQLAPGAFLRAVADAADCGLVLDVENLHADGWNLGTDAEALIAAVPVERVVEVHLAGGRRVLGEYLDSHDGPVPDATWRLYEALCRRCVLPLTLIEREAALPPFDVLLGELDAARAVARTVISAASAAGSTQHVAAA